MKMRKTFSLNIEYDRYLPFKFTEIFKEIYEAKNLIFLGENKWVVYIVCTPTFSTEETLNGRILPVINLFDYSSSSISTWPGGAYVSDGFSTWDEKRRFWSFLSVVQYFHYCRWELRNYSFWSPAERLEPPFIRQREFLISATSFESWGFSDDFFLLLWIL